MDRRRFIQDSLMLAGATLLPVKLGAETTEKWKIEYIREKVPAFEIPPYVGARYEDQVPDTLDIAERAKLGINCLTGITDPQAYREIYFLIDFHRNPPVMIHDFDDTSQNASGFLEALPLLRAATGSDLNNNVDRVWMESLLKSIGPDGLVYIPFKGNPWIRIGGDSPALRPLWRTNGRTTDVSDTSVTQVTHPNFWPRVMAAMIVYYQRDRNLMWKQTIEQMIQGMNALATDQGEYAFFPAGGYEPNKKFYGDGQEWGGEVMAIGLRALGGGTEQVIQGLAQYYRATGYEPARVLGGKLTKYIRFRSETFDKEGRFLSSTLEKDADWMIKYYHDNGGWLTTEEIKNQELGGHFADHALALLDMVEYGAVVGDRELLEWCRSSYEWARTQGNPLIGFFPEFIIPGYPSCESCEVGYMISIAVKLTKAGISDNWDDIDRWTRNQFAENQLVDGDWVYKLAATLPKQAVAFNESDQDVVKRNLGGFAGWASGNEWAVRLGIMHCCTGTCTRAIYYVWQNIVETKGDEFRLNLLLNRASASADVYSFIPYEGRVQVKMKKPFENVLLRVPEWVSTGSPEVKAKVNGTVRELSWQGRYVNVGAMKTGEAAELTFPIETRTVSETIGAMKYNLEIKGNTVVSIDPPGKTGPIYARQHYRSDKAPWKKVQRFAPEEEISW